jgi:hypothetical protein
MRAFSQEGKYAAVLLVLREMASGTSQARSNIKTVHSLTF